MRVSSWPLLASHRDFEVLLGRDEVVVGVVAEVDSDPADLPVVGVAVGGVVGGDGGAGVAADVGRFVEGEEDDVRSVDVGGRGLAAVDVEGGGAAFAQAPAVVGELDPNLMLARCERLRGAGGGELLAAEAVGVGRASVFDVQAPAAGDSPLVDQTPSAPSSGTMISAVIWWERFLTLSTQFSFRPPIPGYRICEVPLIRVGRPATSGSTRSAWRRPGDDPTKCAGGAGSPGGR